jgi:nucleotide sugar dehydrogenase
MGLGYVGLPLAANASAAGLRTVGFDISAGVVAGLRAGRSHVADVPDREVARMLDSGFCLTTDPAVISDADTVVICVPTGLADDGAPDLGPIIAATRTVAANLRPRALVVLESTTYPGTTEELVRPMLEEMSGLRVGEDFHLAYSPERVDPGNARFGIRNTPKIIGGCTALCAKYGVAFYGRFVDTLVVSRGTREAEMAKLLENTHRYVNIALVNEVALCCDRMGIDVWDVLHCAATKPFGYSAFTPGPGIGGHCIPIDPLYLASKAEAEGFSFAMLSAARDVNGRMPGHVVGRAVNLLAGRGVAASEARVLLLGVAYKPDVADVRESPAVPIATSLRSLAATVSYHDPGVEEFAPGGEPLQREPDLDTALAAADLAILLQDHKCYDPLTLMSAQCALLDTRGKTTGGHVTLL